MMACSGRNQLETFEIIQFQIVVTHGVHMLCSFQTYMIFMSETQVVYFSMINPLRAELNPSAQRCLPRFFLGILIFKGLNTRRLYKSFGFKGLIQV
jgi:hypothetical protein